MEYKCENFKEDKWPCVKIPASIHIVQGSYYLVDFDLLVASVTYNSDIILGRNY